MNRDVAFRTNKNHLLLARGGGEKKRVMLVGIFALVVLFVANLYALFFVLSDTGAPDFHVRVRRVLAVCTVACFVLLVDSMVT